MNAAEVELKDELAEPLGVGFNSVGCAIERLVGAAEADEVWGENAVASGDDEGGDHSAVEKGPVGLAVEEEDGAVGGVAGVELGKTNAGDEEVAGWVREGGDGAQAGEGHADEAQVGGGATDALGSGKGKGEGNNEENEEKGEDADGWGLRGLKMCLKNGRSAEALVGYLCGAV